MSRINLNIDKIENEIYSYSSLKKDGERFRNKKLIIHLNFLNIRKKLKYQDIRKLLNYELFTNLDIAIEMSSLF